MLLNSLKFRVQVSNTEQKIMKSDEDVRML
jgi:hypothetical protein